MLDNNCLKKMRHSTLLKKWKYVFFLSDKLFFTVINPTKQRMKIYLHQPPSLTLFSRQIRGQVCRFFQLRQVNLIGIVDIMTTKDLVSSSMSSAVCSFGNIGAVAWILSIRYILVQKASLIASINCLPPHKWTQGRSTCKISKM